MANIDTNTAANPCQKRFSKKRKTFALRIDMTPMVDLGFLLITFFIFTATMDAPKVMDLFMPEEEGAPTPIPQSGAFSIIAGKNGAVFYYEGAPLPGGENFRKSSLTDIRGKIINKKREVEARYKPDVGCESKAVANKTNVNHCKQKDLFVLIKPTKDADYKTIVGLLDEMTINDIARYAIQDADTATLTALRSLK